MKDFDEYKNTMAVPVKPTMLCPNCGTFFRKEHVFCSKCAYNVKYWFNDCMDIYKAERQAYDIRTDNLMNKFQRDCLEDVGLTNHPKANEIFWYAWERGHSYGFSEVYDNLIDMSYLFEDDTNIDKATEDNKDIEAYMDVEENAIALIEDLANRCTDLKHWGHDQEYEATNNSKRANHLAGKVNGVINDGLSFLREER